MTEQDMPIGEAGELCKPPNKVIAKVVSQDGFCWAGHKVGDEFQVLGGLTPPGLCPMAYHNMFHFATVLLYGGVFSWAIPLGRDPDTEERVACPNPANPVVFDLRRVPL